MASDPDCSIIVVAKSESKLTAGQASSGTLRDTDISFGNWYTHCPRGGISPPPTWIGRPIARIACHLAKVKRIPHSPGARDDGIPGWQHGGLASS